MTTAAAAAAASAVTGEKETGPVVVDSCGVRQDANPRRRCHSVTPQTPKAFQTEDPFLFKPISTSTPSAAAPPIAKPNDKGNDDADVVPGKRSSRVPKKLSATSLRLRNRDRLGGLDDSTPVPERLATKTTSIGWMPIDDQRP